MAACLKTRAHDGLTRMLHQKKPWTLLLRLFVTNLIANLFGDLIIDDTVIHKPHSKASRLIGEIIRWTWSSSDGKPVKGISVVLLLLRIGKLRLPIGFRIYDGSRSKIDLAMDMLSDFRNQHCRNTATVLFDSWYSANRLLKRIDDYGWRFVCRIKRNRNFNEVNIKCAIKTPYGSSIGTVGKVKVRLVKHRKHLIITNRISLVPVEVRKLYLKRSQIEEVFKILKSQFHLSDCQSRLKAVWEAHICLCMSGFAAVEFKNGPSGVTIYKARLSLNLQDYEPELNLLQRLWDSA